MLSFGRIVRPRMGMQLSSRIVSRGVSGKDGWKKDYFLEKQALLTESQNDYFKRLPSTIKINNGDFPQGLTVEPSWRLIEGLKVLKDVGKGDKSDDPIVAARLDGKVISLHEPIGRFLSQSDENVVKDVDYLRFSSKEGKSVYWHSAAHVLGNALEAHYGPKVSLCDGPSVLDAEGGFFYEMFLRDNLRVNETIYKPLEALSKELADMRAPFERIELSREEAAVLFADNPFKLDLLRRIPAGEIISVYRCGPFIDLCRGPHVPHTGLFKAFKYYKSSGSHWHPPPIPQGNESIQIPGELPTGTELLQRVYGIAFPSKKQLDDWNYMVEEARKRDHRIVGRAQNLFFFHDVSPGSAFFLPAGQRIYNRLIEMLRSEYRKRGYEEVASPLMYRSSLWKTSGHLEAYAENMFGVQPGMGLETSTSKTPPFDSTSSAPTPPSSSKHAHSASQASGIASKSLPEASSCADITHAHDSTETEDIMGLKPMNCPGHCVIFAHKQLSYRDLPLRLADFSPLHRNEATGALGGLTRLRRFAQDDAHIFCASHQISQEIVDCLEFVASVYKLFGFSFRMKLSTRPEVYVGDLETWDNAETALRDALMRFFDCANDQSNGSTDPSSNIVVEVDEGGGAFYGPKIDVFVQDAIGREHQCATVQLDFQLPKRFDLSYKDSSGKEERPVMIHRAVLGSLERMMGILIEHTAGKWPFWLSPRQILLCPVADKHVPYAKKVSEFLRFPPLHWSNYDVPSVPSYFQPGSTVKDEAENSNVTRGDSGLWIEIDDSARSVGKKVREGQLEAWNIIVVLGDQEEANNSLSLRFRDKDMYSAFLDALEAVYPKAVEHAPPLPPASVLAPVSLKEEDAFTSKKGNDKSAKPNKGEKGDKHANEFFSPLVTLTIPTAQKVFQYLQIEKTTSDGSRFT